MKPIIRFPEFGEEWKAFRLGEIYTFKITNSLSRENLNYEHGSVKNIHYGDIHTKFATLFEIDKNQVPFVNPNINISKISPENYCQEGDMVFADASEDLNDVGKSIEIYSLKGQKLLAGLHTLLARPQKNRLALGFGAFLFKSPTVRLQIQKQAQGTKVLSISATRLSSILLTVPSLAEQEKIGNFLSLIDQKIQGTEKLLQDWKNYKKALLQQIFSQQIRFQDPHGKDFEDWKVFRLGEIAEIVGGGTPDTTNPNFWNGTIEWFTPTELKKKYLTESLRKITEEGLKQSSAKILPIGTILFSSRATVGDVSINLKECTTNQGFQSFIVNPENYNQFLYYWILHNKNEFIKRASGSTFLEISKATISKMEIQVPSLAEQEKIGNFLSLIDQKIQGIEKLLQYWKNYKKALLQAMFV